MAGETPDYKTEYLTRVRTFEKLIEFAVQVSGSSGGIQTSNLGIEATKVYTRLTLSAITLSGILPENSFRPHDLWDLPSLASLSRAFLEMCHRHLHLSEKDLTPEEAEFRLDLFVYHMNCEKFRMWKELGRSADAVAEFDKRLPVARDKLISSPRYQLLSPNIADKVKRGVTDMYVTDEEVATRYKLLSGHFRGIYRLLSNRKLPRSVNHRR